MNIVASCTDRKRGAVPEDRRLGQIPIDEPHARAARWWQRLDSTKPLFGVEASQVYVGEHWNLVQSLAQHLRQRGWHVDLWIASAGYGLLSERTPIAPYSSTFAENSPDEVARGHTGAARHKYHEAWWAALADLRASHEEKENPTRLAELAARHPDANLLLLGSPDYVRAMHEDLLLAVERMQRPERLAILTSDDGWKNSPLSDNIVKVDERTRSLWGGTMQGLHARTALNLFKDKEAPRGAFSVRELRDRYTGMVDDKPRPEKFNRDRMSDSEVVDFLRAELAKNPDAGWTLLLRTLRNSGKACEQKRFRSLHAEISSTLRSGDKSRDTGET